ncbi:MAG: hypothetical protein RLY93_13195 [Sumerlaeia bacterium]
MNHNQKAAIIVVIAIMALMFLFPPFSRRANIEEFVVEPSRDGAMQVVREKTDFQGRVPMGYGFILFPPTHGEAVRVNFGRLFLQYFVLAGVSLPVIFLLRRRVPRRVFAEPHEKVNAPQETHNPPGGRTTLNAS